MNAIIIVGDGVVRDRGVVCTVKINGRHLVPRVSTVFDGEAVDRGVADGHVDTRGGSRAVDDGGGSVGRGGEGDVGGVHGEGKGFNSLIVGAWLDLDRVVCGIFDEVVEHVSDVARWVGVTRPVAVTSRLHPIRDRSIGSECGSTTGFLVILVKRCLFLVLVGIVVAGPCFMW